jgi:maltose alpha-D-glucosyltransferase/alpha-amylase
VGGKTREDEADQLTGYTSFARTIGTRLAELHALLARPSPDPAFDPVPFSAADAKALGAGAATQLQAAFDSLAKIDEHPNEETARAAAFVLDNRARITKLLPTLANAATGTLATRIHGDFHLGQVLVGTGDAYIIDFEGEPAKKLEVRRAKSSPVRDVAGLLRSFHYAAAAAALGPATTTGAAAAQPLARFVEEVSAQFLAAYRTVERSAAPRWIEDEAAEAALLDLFLLEKSAYEICYEAANRPTWLAIPLRGFAEIAGRLLKPTRALQDA